MPNGSPERVNPPPVAFQGEAATHYTIPGLTGLAVWIACLCSNAWALPRVALAILLMGGGVGGFMCLRTFPEPEPVRIAWRAGLGRRGRSSPTIASWVPWAALLAAATTIATHGSRYSTGVNWPVRRRSAA